MAPAVGRALHVIQEEENRFSLLFGFVKLGAKNDVNKKA